jgi:Caspase domain
VRTFSALFVTENVVTFVMLHFRSYRLPFLSPLLFLSFSGCHNDARNIKKFLENVHGFRESEMLILMDDGRHHSPTKKNIEDAFKRITEYSQAGDVVFVHYSGHVSLISSTYDCWRRLTQALLKYSPTKFPVSRSTG